MTPLRFPLLILFLFSFLLPHSSLVKGAQKEMIYLLPVNGEARLIRQGKETSLKNKISSENNDILLLNKKSELHILLPKKGVLKIQGKSQVIIQNWEKNRLTIKLNYGRLINRSDTSSVEIILKTPSASVDARQAIFLVEVKHKKQLLTSSFAVSKGKIEVLANISQNKLTLKENQAIDIPLDPQLSSPRPILTSEQKYLS